MPREFFARPSVPVAPDLLGCVLEHQTEGRPGRGRAHRGGGVCRGQRSRLARLPREDGAERGDVRPARARLRVLHLRHALLRQPGLPGQRQRVRGPAAAGRIVEGEELARARRTGGARGVRGDGSPRKNKAIPFRDLARGRPGCARRSTSTGRWTARTSASPSRRCACAGRTRVPRPVRQIKRSSAARGSGSRPRPRCRGGSGLRASRPSRRTGGRCRDIANWLPPRDR